MSQKVYSVSELNRETGLILNEHFLSILVEGEISNLSIPASGHCYFTLKDAYAQVRCAMFRSQQRRQFKPENGKHVIVKAQVSLYEPRGDYQLIVEYMEEAGQGALQRAFDALVQKLSMEGLFAQEKKKPLPILPKAIGVITSPTGAAVRDILTVLRRRFAAIPVIIYPVAVQGEQAKYEICAALETANSLKLCDVLILARGGGSMEDLWAFNEEMVARAIFASSIPIISGIGHETDVTIADFAADLRAPTPSAAAEHATPDQIQWLEKIGGLERRLQQQLARLLMQQQQKTDWLSGRLQQQHPRAKLERNRQRLAELDTRLINTQLQRLSASRERINSASARLWQRSPVTLLRTYRQQLIFHHDRLMVAINTAKQQKHQRLQIASQTLHTVSPLATLSRGYALVTDDATGRIIRTTQQLKIGSRVKTRLASGEFLSRVETLLNE
ncbi:MAG: exodeoxyribonuclease VII large subunit [Gammaproteobacteria bacterium]|nr:exodeoxyribonuclease VII large subunit [Gammaproteobacteria bacterium]